MRLRKVDRDVRLRRAEVLHACGWDVASIAKYLSMTAASVCRHLKKPEVQARVAAIVDRPLMSLSKVQAAAIQAAQDRLIEALPAVADRLVRAAMAPFTVTVERDGEQVTIPNPEFPQSFIAEAIKLVLDRGGITQRLAESITGSEPREIQPAPTPEHIEALAKLVQAARSLPPPPTDPPR